MPEVPHYRARHAPSLMLHLPSTQAWGQWQTHHCVVVGDGGEQVVAHVGVGYAVVEVGEDAVVAVHGREGATQPVPLLVVVVRQGCSRNEWAVACVPVGEAYAGHTGAAELGQAWPACP